ncbi:MAG: glycosyltransferase family 4 protein, partial [Gemmatimonadaceae bacterium]
MSYRARKEPSVALFLHRGGSQIRGSEEVLLALLSRLDRTEFLPVVIASDPVMQKAVRDLGIECEVHNFPEIMIGLREIKLPVLRYVAQLRALHRFCRSREVQVVVCNGGLPCQLGVPLARLHRVSSLCLFHHPAAAQYHRFWLTRRVDQMVYVSNSTAQHTRERLGRTDGDVVYTGVDSERIAPPQQHDPAIRKTLGIEEEAIVFAQIGALVKGKGHPALLKAFARAREMTRRRLHLVIVGKGAEREDLENLARKLGLAEAVSFTGYVPSTLPFYQHVIDVNVLASEEEGLGLVNIEAAAAGLPSIGNDCTGIRES